MGNKRGPLMPAIYLTRHARNRLRRWQLTEDDARMVLAAPDRVTASVHGRMNAWKQTPAGWLRVTYRDEPGRQVIITVTQRRRGPAEEG